MDVCRDRPGWWPGDRDGLADQRTAASSEHVLDHCCGRNEGGQGKSLKGIGRTGMSKGQDGRRYCKPTRLRPALLPNKGELNCLMQECKKGLFLLFLAADAFTHMTADRAKLKQFAAASAQPVDAGIA